MPVPTVITDLTAVASTNSPQGTETVKGTIDDYFRAHASFIRQTYDSLLGPTVVLASAATVNIGFAASQNIGITGTTTITAFDTYAEGTLRWVVFAGALTLTHNATTLQLPGAVSIVTTAGDAALFKSLGGGNWKCMDYQRINGQGAIACLPLGGGVLTGDVGMNNNVKLLGKDTGGTLRQIVSYGGDNNVNFLVGQGGQWRAYNAAGAAVVFDLSNNGDLSIVGDMTFSNVKGIKMRDGGGTARTIMYVGADNWLNTFNPGAGIRWWNQAASVTTASLDNSGNFLAITVGQTSDENYKSEWAPAPADLIEQVAAIEKAGTFTWKGKHEELGRGIGVGAQSLEAVMPEAVQTQEDGFKTVQYGPAAMVIIVELSKRLLAMEKQLADLVSK